MRGLYKNFVFDIVISVLCLALGIIMLPVFNISTHFIDIMLAIALVAYLVLFLFDVLRRAKGTVFILTIVEFVVIAMLAVGLLFQQFSVIARISSVCSTVGLVMWLRGVVMAIGIYLHALGEKKPRLELARFITAIILISIGAYLFASTIFTDEVIEWVLCIALFVCCLIFGALAYLFSPIKKGEKKEDEKKSA